MRRTLLVGLVLAFTAVLVVAVSGLSDLELEPVALVGLALGAVVALVPDRTPLMRLAGFAGGFVVAWISYVLRASLLPDSTAGRAVAFGLVMLLVTAIAGLSFDRIPLWAPLVGVATMAGAYEYTYTVSPPEVMTTSMSVATAVLLTAAVGFLAAALVAPQGNEPTARQHRAPKPADDAEDTKLDDMMMEKTK